MSMMTFLFHNRRGFNLVELLITLAVGSTLSLVTASLLAVTAENKTRAMEMAALESVKQNILKNLGNSASWNRTVLSNPSMACLIPANNIDCPPNAPTDFTLFDANGVAVADSLNPNSGFDKKGQPCGNFNINRPAGSDACPYKFWLRWSAVCAGWGKPTCTNPEVLVNAHLYYRPNPNTAHDQIIQEDLHSINDFYISNLAGNMCLSNVQQVFIYNTTPGVPLVTNFVVPNFTNALYVELWGGGGGGTGQNSMIPWPGNPGGPSQFGAAFAAGGQGGGNWWAFGSMGCCWSVPICIGVGAGPINGFPAGSPTNPNLLAGLNPNSCSPVNSSNLGGAGGPGAAVWNNPWTGGLYGGGGGGAGWLWGDGVTGCPIFALFGVGAGPGVGPSSGGQYFTPPIPYTPLSLPPGTSVLTTIGAGGAGGGVSTCVWLGFPFCVVGAAGAGASGVAKITWQ